MGEKILEVKHLRTHFIQKNGCQTRAVDDLSYSVEKGEFTAIIGESGSGKTVSALSLLRLIPYPPGLILDGEVLFEGRDLMQISDAEMEKVRGKEISMIFQEASAALNPVLTIGEQISEAITTHIPMSGKEAWEKSIELLRMVDIPNPEERVKQYPFEFSGGMQQRSMIAMAMSCGPKILICDEPTTALDVTVQAQVLEQIDHLRKKTGTTIILITHNLGVVARYADSVKIMYGGRIVEEGKTDDIFHNAHHPYTEGLIRAVPRLDREADTLWTIEGEPPDMSIISPDSCAFAARCPYADERCRTQRPELEDVGEEHRCACFYKEKVLENRGGEAQ